MQESLKKEVESLRRVIAGHDSEMKEVRQRLAAVEADLARTSEALQSAKLELLAAETRLDSAQNDKDRTAPSTPPRIAHGGPRMDPDGVAALRRVLLCLWGARQWRWLPCRRAWTPPSAI